MRLYDLFVAALFLILGGAMLIIGLALSGMTISAAAELVAALALGIGGCILVLVALMSIYKQLT